VQPLLSQSKPSSEHKSTILSASFRESTQFISRTELKD
jgi:hypothetical protein